MTKPPLYWICQDQQMVLVRLADMLQLPADEAHLTEEELELMHRMLRIADDVAHSTIVDLVKGYKDKRDRKP